MKDIQKKILNVFQNNYPDTCGIIEFDQAKSCLPYIRNQRNFTIFLCCIMIIFRLITLFLMWKYINDEYNGTDDELVRASTNTGTRSSTATSVA